MRAPARLATGLAAWIVIGGVAFLLFSIEQQIAGRRAAFYDFDERAAGVASALYETGIAQQGYLAEEQNEESWLPRITAAIDSASAKVDGLHARALDTEAASALLEAGSRIADLGTIEARVRDYLASGERLMAIDVAFGEGRKATAEAADLVGDARRAERLASTAFEASARDLQTSYLAAASGLLALMIALLAMARVRQHQPVVAVADTPKSANETDDLQVSVGAILHLTEAVTPPHTGTGGGDGNSSRTINLSTADDTAHHQDEHRQPAWQAVADLCSDLGRVTTVEQMQPLLARVAAVVEASGLVVWLVDRASGHLRPVLAHGYPPRTLARMSALSPSADNAAAAAFRTGRLQVVRPRATGASSAVVAPLLAQDGCVGVLSAELAGDVEPSNTLSALATIFAAQLSSMLGGSVSISEEPATDAVSPILAARNS